MKFIERAEAKFQSRGIVHEHAVCSLMISNDRCVVRWRDGKGKLHREEYERSALLSYQVMT